MLSASLTQCALPNPNCGNFSTTQSFPHTYSRFLKFPGACFIFHSLNFFLILITVETSYFSHIFVNRNTEESHILITQKQGKNISIAERNDKSVVLCARVQAPTKVLLKI
jgi:hypothetical protein